MAEFNGEIHEGLEELVPEEKVEYAPTVVNAIPVWKDTFYVTEADELQYTIRLDGEPIFHAKAYKMPGADELKINVNKICSNYLFADITPLLETFRDSGGFIDDYSIEGNIRTFTLESNGTTLASYRFIKDWSYERMALITTNRSLPINGHYADKMLTLSATITTDDFILNNDAEKYKTPVCDARYALYYENAYAGFDSFLIEGKVIHKDGIVSHTYSTSFVNTSAQHEMKRYIDEIKGTYELHTGLLTDTESERLIKHLITSNQVYMHDLKTGDIFPVVITNNDVEYLNYRNNKMFSHTINVAVSQNRIRK